MAEASRPTPYIEPAALGVPVADFLDGFRGEGCDDTPQSLRFELHDAEGDAAQIVRFLSRLSKGYATNPCIIAFARCLIGDHAKDNPVRENFETIAAWVLNKVIYQADPRGIEYVVSPVQMLRRWKAKGAAYGDCDDHVLLLNSLLGAVGIETRVVAVMLPAYEDRPASTVFNHVISQVNTGKGWFDFDACNKTNPLHKFTGERITL